MQDHTNTEEKQALGPDIPVGAAMQAAIEAFALLGQAMDGKPHDLLDAAEALDPSTFFEGESTGTDAEAVAHMIGFLRLIFKTEEEIDAEENNDV